MRYVEVVLLLVATTIGIGTGDPWLMLVILILAYLSLGFFKLFTCSSD